MLVVDKKNMKCILTLPVVITVGNVTWRCKMKKNITKEQIVGTALELSKYCRDAPFLFL